MTDAIQLPSGPIGPGPEYTGARIWLPQLLVEAGQQGEYEIVGRTFVDCVLEGPAVMAPIAGCHFDDCHLGAHGGDPRILMLTPLSEAGVVGPIPFRNCTFRRCTFVGVGYTGAPQFLQQLQDMYRDNA